MIQVLRDRRVRACALVAVLLAFGNEWWNTGAHVMGDPLGDSEYWFSRLSSLAPYAVALVALVWSARPGAGVFVAGTALVASLVAVELDTGIDDLTAGVSLLGVLAYVLNVAALLPADLAAAARGMDFDPRSGAVTGFVCGLVLAAVAFLWVLPRVTDVPAWYVLGGYVFPPLGLALAGALAGAVSPAEPA